MADYNEKTEGPNPQGQGYVDPNTEPSLAGFERYALANNTVRLPSYPAWGDEYMKQFENLRTSEGRQAFERYTAEQPYAENAKRYLTTIDNIARALNGLREGSYAEQPLEGSTTTGPVSLEERLIEKRHQNALDELQRNLQQAINLQMIIGPKLREDVQWVSTAAGEEWKDPAKLPFQFLGLTTDVLSSMKAILRDAAHRR